MLTVTISKRFPLDGASLRRFRKRHRITQEEFASYAGISTPTIIEYEKGRPVKPSTAELIEYAKTRLSNHPEEIEEIRSRFNHFVWEEE